MHRCASEERDASPAPCWLRRRRLVDPRRCCAAFGRRSGQPGAARSHGGCGRTAGGYIPDMSFVLILVLLAIVGLVVLRLISHDARAPRGSESHHPPAP